MVLLYRDPKLITLKIVFFLIKERLFLIYYSFEIDRLWNCYMESVLTDKI